MLDVNGSSLTTRRGQILVFGGDQVYPSASFEHYRDHTLGPYRAALPWLPDDNPHLYAVPGNHDWYDGLTSFMRVFCQRQWVGAWQTQQDRSYFALLLPHRWWLWAIDVQLDAYIDEPQLDYFRDVAAQLKAGDAVILCSALPGWIDANLDDPEGYSRLDYLERKLIRPTGAEVRLSLAGDSHCYARYAAVEGDAQKVISGGGGAFLSATHHLPDELELPPAASREVGRTTPPARYAKQASYPDASTSRRQRLGVALLPFRNWDFWVLIGAIHLVYLGLLQASLRQDGERFDELMRRVGWTDLAQGLLRSPVALLLTALIVGCLVGFTKVRRTGRHPWKRWIGVPHALAHLAVVGAGILLVAYWLDGVGSPGWYAFWFVVLVAVVGGLLGSWVTAAYLIVADLVGCNTNELFAAQRIRHHKGFVRMHLDRDGVLTLHPIGLRRTVRRWQPRTGGGPSDSWLIPRGADPAGA